MIWGTTIGRGFDNMRGVTPVLPTTDATKRIAAELRSVRGRANISVAEVVRLAGTSKDRTYDIFNGRVSPTVDELARICDVMHVHLALLIRNALP